MKEFLTPNKRIEYKHCIIYNDVKYVREETLSLKHYAWESKPKEILDFHTINWSFFNDDYSSPVEYFCLEHGWSGEDGHCRKSNPIPEIEKIFKETIGKDLIYFKYSK